jgi:hypothetical protein
MGRRAGGFWPKANRMTLCMPRYRTTVLMTEVTIKANFFFSFSVNDDDDMRGMLVDALAEIKLFATLNRL